MSKLRVWHIPQFGGPTFYVPVESPEEAKKVLSLLARYDIFQFENRIKPDYASAQGLEEYCPEEDEWLEWESEDGLEISEWGENT